MLLFNQRRNCDRDKTVLIPVIVHDDKMTPLYGGQMPRFADGAVLDIVLEMSSLADSKEVERFDVVKDVTLFSAGEILYFEINPKSQINSKEGFVKREEICHWEKATHVMPVVIHEELRLRLRGTRSAQLLSCWCECLGTDIPKAISINQMLTFLSVKFETWRQSHTGNVYKSVYCRVSKPGEKIKLQPLDDIRDNCQAGHELELFSRSWPNMEPGG